MKRAIEATKQEFESASYRTPEYLAWHRLFKRELTAFLKSLGCQEVQFSKPNHFDASGFFRTPNGQAWYFSLGDLRGFKNDLLVRTAKDDRDFTGGMNQYVSLSSEATFATEMRRILKV